MPATSERGRLLVAATIPEMHEVFLLPYARHMRSLGWQVDGMANGIPASAACAEAYDQLHDVSWFRNPLDPRNLLSIPEQLRQLVKREDYDVVHVHAPVAGFVTRFALRSMLRPSVVYTAHGFHFHSGGDRLRNAVFAGLEKLAAPWTDELIVINREDAEAAERLRLAAPDHLHHFPGIGVDLERFRARRPTPDEAAATRAELGLRPDVPLVLMIAEFIPRKRHEDAINAFTAVWGDAELLLVGKGPLVEEMQQLAASLGISRRVRFLGYRDDIPRLLGIAELLILPSLQEGLPMSVLEAMSVGVPVIATDIRGTRDLLEDGAGVLVPVDSPAALAHAMNALLSNPARRDELRRAAAERVGRFALPVLLELHERLYERLLRQQRERLDAATHATRH